MARRRGGQGGRGGRRRPTPQPPPAPEPAAPQGGTPGYYEYNEPVASQLSQPYQDLLMGGAVGALPGVFGNLGQQQQMGGIYGQGAAMNLGGAQQGMRGLAPLGAGAGGLMGGTMGQYAGLMDPNYAIQQGLARNIRDIQAGKADFDPFLTQQFNDQERVLREQLRRQLGPDYENSSAGIEALGKFGQQKTTALGSAQFNRLNQLVGMQQGGMQNIANQGLGYGNFAGGLQQQQFGQGAQLGTMFGNQMGQLYDQSMGLGTAGQNAQQAYLNRLGAQQGLYGNIPKTMGQFGAAMSDQAGAAVGAQQPFQTDRFGQFQASKEPTGGQMWGQMMGQSGNRWIDVGNSIGQMGPGQ